MAVNQPTGEKHFKEELLNSITPEKVQLSTFCWEKPNYWAESFPSAPSTDLSRKMHKPRETTESPLLRPWWKQNPQFRRHVGNEINPGRECQLETLAVFGGPWNGKDSDCTYWTADGSNEQALSKVPGRDSVPSEILPTSLVALKLTLGQFPGPTGVLSPLLQGQVWR